jgi:hypothetical protein
LAKNIKENILYGEEEVRKLSSRSQINEGDMIRGFREYLQLQGIEIRKQLLQLKRTLEKIATSSSECERGFSEMNLIVTPARSSLSIKTITSLLFIKIVEPPLTQFDPTKYVRLWLLQGQHSAVDTKSKERKRTEETSQELNKIWTIF